MTDSACGYSINGYLGSPDQTGTEGRCTLDLCHSSGTVSEKPDTQCLAIPYYSYPGQSSKYGLYARATNTAWTGKSDRQYFGYWLAR
jgi:hypothetical protein